MNLPEIKLIYNNPIKKSKRIQIKKSKDAEKVFREIFNSNEIEIQEQMVVLYLNNSSEILGYTKHSVGGITATVVDIRIILAGALKSLSTGILVCHNHPSGSLSPSKHDTTITTKLKNAAKEMDIDLLDHIILTKEGYYSFSDEGLNGVKSGYGSRKKEDEINIVKDSKQGIVYLDLFSGTGGFSKGLSQAGYKFNKHYFSEVDKYAIANYHYNFNQAIHLGDITKINAKTIEKPNLITFGSPCQDISIAGKRNGLKGKRSNLFFEAVRIINECRPDIFIFENVKGLFSSNQGKDFEIVLQTFADLGLYDIQWQLLNTSWFLPQNRERIYFVGCIRGKTQPQIFPIGESYQGSNAFHQKESQRKSISPTIDTKVGESTHRSPYVLHWKGSSTKWKYDQMKTSPALNTQQDWIRQPLIASGAAYLTCNYNGEGTQIKLRKDKIANQLNSGQKDSMIMLRELTKNETESNRVYESKNGISKTLKASGHGTASQTGYYKINQLIRRLTPIECERLQGFPDDWTKQGLFNNKIDDISDSQRYKLLGNAVSVPVIKLIGERLLNKKITSDICTDRENSREKSHSKVGLYKQEVKQLALELELELLNFNTTK